MKFKYMVNFSLNGEPIKYEDMNPVKAAAITGLGVGGAIVGGNLLVSGLRSANSYLRKKLKGN